MQVRSPEPEFSGEVAGVQFVDGVSVGEVSSSALQYFRGAGYRVEPVVAGGSDAGGSSRAPMSEPPSRSASKAAWVTYAVECGADEATARKSSKAELIETYGGAS